MPNRTYYWQVRACADPGRTVFTDADIISGRHFSFTTDQLPAPFSKSSPIDNAAAQPLTVTLIWQPAAYVDHYRYCVSTAPGCTPLTSVGTATNTNFVGIPGQSYHWQVRACSEATCSAFRDGVHSQTGADAWPQLVEGSAHECSTQCSLSQRATSACLARSLACLAPDSTMPLPIGK